MTHDIDFDILWFPLQAFDWTDFGSMEWMFDSHKGIPRNKNNM